MLKFSFTDFFTLLFLFILVAGLFANLRNLFRVFFEFISDIRDLASLDFSFFKEIYWINFFFKVEIGIIPLRNQLKGVSKSHKLF